MAKEVSRQLAKRVEEIARYLLPNGKRYGNEWCVGNINGEIGESLKLHLVGDKAGVWCDFATGDKGDLLDLWTLNRNLKISEAIKEASSYLGITLPEFEAHRSPKFVKPSLKVISPLTTNSPVTQYLTADRKLNKETINAYKISEKNGQIVFPYWRDNELIF